MKALAYKFDRRVYCCACAKQLAKTIGYPALVFMSNKPVKINAEASCPRCGDFYGSPLAQEAAVQIAKMMRSK